MSEAAAFSIPRFFIFGDSHAGTIMQAAKALALDFAGGSIMAGMHMNEEFFKVRGRRFVMTTEMGKDRLETRLDEASLSRNFLDVQMPILSTVGFNTHNFAHHFAEAGLAIATSEGKRLISRACFRAVVEAARPGALDFYRVLASEKKNVFAVLSPQIFDPDEAAVCQAFDEVMISLVTSLGVQIVDVRAETTDSDGVLLRQFARAEDNVHGNDAFGELVLRKFAQMIASEPA